MINHSTRRAAFLAAVRDAFDEHYPRPRPGEPEWEGNHFAERAEAAEARLRALLAALGQSETETVAEAIKRQEDKPVTLPEYAALDSEGNLHVTTSAGNVQVIFGVWSPDGLDRIAVACAALAAIKRREAGDA